ncbi:MULTISPECIES: retron Ec78 anti-phage system effector HNH endonuclease PtuB [Serratia]|uniref:retron Ec78 anti-phage system effector HNH endonuclease PtuB n=1 Tax=Serratia TaxID=613 RepID=UPI0024C5EEF0|nr:retron Ec78 anti-phage system effector HNH endonuclease PtuB [Serratia marcescens]MDI3227723.1 TIGR02646 family protein [Serratia marcescens]WAZ17183.1 TIGR02646 family protein [Serratia marcescens]HEN7340875.1 TIGR02646 family protein [Serratia marcescens]HEN7411617.1 TIGR02646 family protein [Serratia marcescens]
MRKLNRPQLAPACLARYNYEIDKWSKKSPKSKDRIIIWRALENMQGKYCCYCESIAEKGNGHIEHFYHKGAKKGGDALYQHLTFDWGNLFASCGFTSGDTCGHYKDRLGKNGPGDYEPNEIIKPDRDDPNDYFDFLQTGSIKIKESISDENAIKARETLRVLNLTHGSLNSARKKQIDIFKQELLSLIEMDIPDEVRSIAMDDIKKSIKKGEFQSAVLGALF